jgi:hypothetical protein
MMKHPAQGWGFRPVDGRDWGGSDKCNESVINEPFERSKQGEFSCSVNTIGAGLLKFRMLTHLCLAGISSSPCLLPRQVDHAAPRTSDLGFEPEAVSACQEEAVSACGEKAESPSRCRILRGSCCFTRQIFFALTTCRILRGS